MQHKIFVFICLLCFIIMFSLSFNFSSLSYQKLDKLSSSISKYLIINGNNYLLLSKTIAVIFLKIGKVKNILDLTYTYFLLSSFFCLYGFFVERKYQNSKNNPLIVAKFIMNLIYCWGCFIMFLGNFIKKTSFTGLLPIFLVSSILFILSVFYINDENSNLLSINNSKDIEIYNNIRLFINSIELKSKNREALMELLSYSYNKINLSQVKKVKNTIGLEKVLEKPKDLLIDNSDIEYLLYQHIDLLFKDSLNIFKNSPILLVNYAVFQIEKLKKFQKSYRTLIKAAELTGLSYSKEFFIYRLKRNLEEKGIKMGIEQTHISYAFQTKQILCLIQKISQYYFQFWNNLLNKNDIVDINHLKELGIKIDELIHIIKEKYKTLVSNGLNTKKISSIYANFTNDVLNDPKEIQELNYNDFENDDKLLSIFFDINHLQSKSDFQFIIVYGYGEFFGIIKKISLGICKRLGYSEKDLINQNINLIIPEFLRAPHEKMLKIKIKYATPQNNSFNNLKESFLLLRNSAKFLVPLYVNNGIIFDENNHPMIFLKLNDIQERKNDNKYKICYILINNKLLIQNFTPNCLNTLGFESYFLNGSFEITQFIPDFYNELLNNLTNETDEVNQLNIKVKLFKDLLLTKNHDKIILNWKNSERFICYVKELKILNETIGFTLELESTITQLDSTSVNKSYTSTTNYNKLKMKNSNQSRKSLIHILQKKDTEMGLVYQNYIPIVEKEVLFNIDAKAFYLKNKNQYYYDDNSLTIKKFFDKKYNQQKTFEKSVKKETEESNLSSSYITSSSSSDYVEEEEEQFSDKMNENNNQENNIDFDESNYQNYYKIKINHIFYSIYDFNNNSFIEIKTNNFESKVEEIIKREKNVTKKVNFELENKNKNKKEAEFRYSLIKKINKKMNVMGKQTISQSNIIKKLISPHWINKSIISLIICYFLSLALLIIIPYITFKNIFNSNKKIYILTSFVHTQCSLSEQIILAYYYLSEFIFLKNPKYKCDYINDRAKYTEIIKQKIISTYAQTEKLLDTFILHKAAISKDSQKIIDTYFYNMSVYWYQGEYTFYSVKKEYLITPSIQTYVFNYISFIYLNSSKQHFLHHTIQYNMENYQKIADGIRLLNKYYLDEMKKISKSNRILLCLIFLFYFSFEIIITLLCIIGNIKSIREKEKYLNIFYKIDIEIIRIMGLKCQKYSNIQIDKKSLAQNQELINSDSEDNDIQSLLTKKEIDINHNILMNKNDQKLYLKNEKIFKNKEFKNLLIFTFIVHFTLIIIVILSILKTLTSFNKFYNSALINVLYMEQEQYFFKNINSLRLNLRNSGLIFYNGIHSFNFEETKDNYKTIFLRIKQLELDIYNNITEKGLPGNASMIIINNLTSGLCDYYDNLYNLSNLTCYDLGENVVDYGIIPIYTYYIKIIFQLLYDFNDIINYIIAKGYNYSDFAYGTELYNDKIPDNVENEEDYLNSNPFLIVNSKGFRDITLIIVNILVPMYQSIIKILFESFDNYYQDNHNFIFIMMVIFYSIIILVYVFHTCPMIYNENKDINKTRSILGVIPKNVLYEIIKNEDELKDKDK